MHQKHPPAKYAFPKSWLKADVLKSTNKNKIFFTNFLVLEILD
tara:strand:+ start:355 stop:483 length:129 start_codon:yes stop_codon:yes gene_type:complete